MATKHTPGPWKQGRHPHNIVAMVEGSEELVASIGEMPCIGGHDDLAAERGAEMECANLNLIIAAPELLAALEDAVQFCHAMFEKPRITHDWEALIAKAKGEAA